MEAFSKKVCEGPKVIKLLSTVVLYLCAHAVQSVADDGKEWAW